MIGAKGGDSSGGVAAMLRPLKRCEEAQGRPAESEAICGNQQRHLTNSKLKTVPNSDGYTCIPFSFLPEAKASIIRIIAVMVCKAQPTKGSQPKQDATIPQILP